MFRNSANMLAMASYREHVLVSPARAFLLRGDESSCTPAFPTSTGVQMTASDPAASSIQILLVDDEQLIVDLLETALKDGGFAVTTAVNGEDAIRLLQAPNSAYRALVTDVNFPSSDLAGWDVAKRAREINPDLPVVYITGGAGHDWAANGVPNSVLVVKPFAPAQIVTAVSQLLNLGNTPGA